MVQGLTKSVLYASKEVLKELNKFFEISNPGGKTELIKLKPWYSGFYNLMRKDLKLSKKNDLIEYQLPFSGDKK